MLRTRKRGFKYYVLKGLLDVDPVTKCWIWLGYQCDGYGIVRRWGNGKRGSSTTVQKWFYELYRGPVPPKMDVAHQCHRRSCCNPHHLRLATRLDNCADWFVDFGFSEEQKAEVARLLALDLTVSVIADRMCVPRPYIHRLARQLDWHKLQTSFDFSLAHEDPYRADRSS
jgi:hypothetical protein